jgi:hypothetical protein
MRKLLGFAFLIAIAAYLKFGNTISDVDYKVKTTYGEQPTQFANQTITYHVPGVVRIAGADIYRPDGYFTQSVVKTPKEGPGQVEGTIVNAMSIAIPSKLDVKKAKLLGLEPAFSFWEESGKWLLLFGVVCLVCVFFWR